MKFWTPKILYKTVQLDTLKQAPFEDGPVMRESLRALSSHPAFRFLLGRLHAQQAILRRRVELKFSKLEDVGFVQAGIFWTGWLEREMAALTQEPQKPELQAEQLDIAAFQGIDQLLERVGIEEIAPQSAE